MKKKKKIGACNRKAAGLVQKDDDTTKKNLGICVAYYCTYDTGYSVVAVVVVVESLPPINATNVKCQRSIWLACKRLAVAFAAPVAVPFAAAFDSFCSFESPYSSLYSSQWCWCFGTRLN